MEKGKSNSTSELASGKTWPQHLQSGDPKSASTIPFSTTRPDKLIRHNISDEELTMISSSNRDYLLESIWGLFGLGAGLLFPSISSIRDAYFLEPNASLSLIDLLQIIFCSVSLIVAITIMVIRWRGNKDATNLVNEIRNRKAVSDV